MIKKKYDLIIAGGGTSGVSCAWNAARLGLNVLIIEKTSCLGGAITNMLVIPAMNTSKKSINNDFFNILYDELFKINGAITYSDGNKGWFNPELTKIILDKLMLNYNVDILFEAEIINVKQNKGKILSVDIETEYDYNKSNFFRNRLLEDVETKYLVDATGDGKICEILNCNLLNKFNEIQPASLRFVLSGVNVKKFAYWLNNLKDNNATSSCTIDDDIYLSTAYTWDENVKWALKPIFDKAIANGDLKTEDANYFQLFSVAGTPDAIAFNAPRIIDNDLSRSQMYIYARQSIFRLLNFCKIYLPGFENSYISSIANKLGIRVSNRYQGEYIYKYEDLLDGKKFDNPVLLSDYPVDIHSHKKNNSTLKYVLNEYELPIEALIVKDYENLFMIGKCISADFNSQAALRIIPSCFSMGEGLAKYLFKHSQNCL